MWTAKYPRMQFNSEIVYGQVSTLEVHKSIPVCCELRNGQSLLILEWYTFRRWNAAPSCLEGVANNYLQVTPLSRAFFIWKLLFYIPNAFCCQKLHSFHGQLLLYFGWFHHVQLVKRDESKAPNTHHSQTQGTLPRRAVFLSFHEALNLSEIIRRSTSTHAVLCLFSIRTNRDKRPWAEKDFCHICSMVFTVHEPLLDFDV